MEEAGKIIGTSYRIVKKLGQGGKGSVYLVINLKTEGFWAAKRIPMDRGQDTHEAEMMKNIRNIHLPVFIDVFQEEGCLWLIMEYIRGICFSRYLEGGRTLPEEQVLDTAIQLSDALIYLEKHEPPICHLDIKPGNMIHTRDGKVMLVDFGAAWKKDAVKKGEGTEGYAAPEQFKRGAAVDVRTDIYGLGASVYRLLSGKTYSMKAPGTRVPGCGEEFSAVILKCLQERPQDRYRDAEKLKAALLRVRRKYAFEKSRRQILSAFAFALPAAALCVTVLPDSMDLSADERWDYEKLLTEARCVPEKQSREYYRKAVFAKPEKAQAYMNILEDAASDGRFTIDEEIFLRDLLHTVPLGESRTNEELLCRSVKEYGKIAEQIGILYRYEYEGEEGKRIASGWFSKAVTAGRDAGEDGQESWLREAEYYLLLGKLELPDRKEYADSDEAADLSKSPEEGLSEAGRYWEAVREGESFLYLEKEERDPLLDLQRLRDTLWQLAFRSADLCQAGISPDEVRQQTDKMKKAADKIAKKAEEEDRGEPAREIMKSIVEADDLAGERLAWWEKSARVNE